MVICVLFTLLPLLAVRKFRRSWRCARRSPKKSARARICGASRSGVHRRRSGGIRDLADRTICATASVHGVVLGVGFGVLGGLAKVVAWSARKWFPAPRAVCGAAGRGESLPAE
jgi:hypothetical protein